MLHKLMIILSLWLSFSVNAQARQYSHQSGELLGSESFFHILIYSSGWLGVFGHDHVIAATGWKSRYEINDKGDFEISMKIDASSLEVDNMQDRSRYAHLVEAGQPAADDILSTRQNMLSEAVLDVKKYPHISVVAKGNLENEKFIINLKIKDHEVTSDIGAVLKCKEGLLRASGDFRLNHQAIGLEPYSAFLGSISIDEIIDFKFEAVTEVACDRI